MDGDTEEEDPGDHWVSGEQRHQGGYASRDHQRGTDSVQGAKHRVSLRLIGPDTCQS